MVRFAIWNHILRLNLGEGSCTFEYLPLKAGTVTGKLIFTGSDLGIYQYDLNLIALPPQPEPTQHFTVALGQTQERFWKIALVWNRFHLLWVHCSDGIRKDSR